MGVGCRWLLPSVSFLPFPASLHLSILPSLFCSCKFYFLALFIIQYFSLNCIERAGYLYCSGSGGDERINETGGCVLNNLIISIIDLIVRNNKEKLFLSLIKKKKVSQRHITL